MFSFANADVSSSISNAAAINGLPQPVLLLTAVGKGISLFRKGISADTMAELGRWAPRSSMRTSLRICHAQLPPANVEPSFERKQKDALDEFISEARRLVRFLD